MGVVTSGWEMGVDMGRREREMVLPPPGTAAKTTAIKFIIYIKLTYLVEIDRLLDPG
jgi:hypothetical protein